MRVVDAINIILPVATGFLGMIIQSILNQKSLQLEREYNLVNKMYDKRITAYQELYEELVKYRSYFMKYIDEGNEYVETYEAKSFAPMTNTNNLIAFFDQREIYFQQESIKKFRELVANTFMLNSLAIAIAGNKEDDLIDSVSPSSIHVIEQIEDLQKHIRKVIGLDGLDKDTEYLLNGKK